MRRIERTAQFKKDYKREMKGKYRSILEAVLIEVLALLVSDSKLPTRYCDHALIGRWNSFRDCHIKPDLILIYMKSDPEILRLVRLGSHSELSL